MFGRSDSVDSTASSLDGLSLGSSHWGLGGGGAFRGGGGGGGDGGGRSGRDSSSFVFLQPHHLARLAEKLNRFGPAEARAEALETLLATAQLGDVCAQSASWDAIRDGMQVGFAFGRILFLNRVHVDACT